MEEISKTNYKKHINSGIMYIISIGIKPQNLSPCKVLNSAKDVNYYDRFIKKA